MIAVGTRSIRRAIAGLAIAAVLGASGCSGGDKGFGIEDLGGQDAAVDAVDFDYVIPPGAGLALDAGEPLSILPADLDAKVGQTIRIVNEDDRGHLVGPWFVGAGETLRQRFASPGEFIGECTVHPSGLITVTVSA
jgi:plastocyanin